MKKIFLPFLLSLCLFSCSQGKKTFIIEGKIDNLDNDTILVYDANGYKPDIDTIFAEKGSFTYKTKSDTLTTFILLFKNMDECPVFAEKGLKVSITGDASSIDQLQVEGGSSLNEEMNSFRESIGNLPKGASRLAQAESFITGHPSSIVSLYLLEKYFVQSPDPDFDKIKFLTGKFKGDIADDPAIKQLSDIIEKENILKIGKSALPFSTTDLKGTAVTLSTYKDKYLLINFWASWSSECRKENSNLVAAYKTYKKKNFTILSVSLDIDKKQLKEAVKKDSLNWGNICDYNGWESYFAKQYGVNQIPTNILINPEGKIIAKDLRGQNLKNKLKEIFK